MAMLYNFADIALSKAANSGAERDSIPISSTGDTSNGSTFHASQTVSPSAARETSQRPRKMPHLEWYKRNCRAALDGMLMLSLEERGAYNTILDLIYLTGDNLLDDDRFICGWLRVDVRVWKRLRASLMDKQKISISEGVIRNFRATAEIDVAVASMVARADVSRSKGIKSGIARRKINNLAEPTPNQNRTDSDIERKKERKEDSPLPPKTAAEDERKTLDACVIAWNLLADEAGLVKVQNITDTRRSKLFARLKEIGGIAGWYAMCDKVRQSRYLRGQVRDWRVSFDWVMSPGNMTKVMEGTYDDRRDAPAGARTRQQIVADETADERARILERARLVEGQHADHGSHPADPSSRSRKFHRGD
jgi:uncharacterized protein YdaU (DUF1376 family)